MPSVNDPCPNCPDGFIRDCNAGECVTCSECSYHAAAISEPEAAQIIEDILNMQVNPQVPVEDTPQEPWWAGFSLPNGILWYRYPEAGRDGQLFIDSPQRPDYLTVITGLREWAAANNLSVYPTGQRPYNIGNGYVQRPNTFVLSNTEGSSTRITLPWQEDFECAFCGETHPAYTTLCPTQNREIRCSACLFYNSDVREIDGLHLCPNCIHVCDANGCEERVYDSVYCEQHGHSQPCSHCDYYMERHVDEDFPTDVNGRILCEDCMSRTCPECGVFSRRELRYSESLGNYVCRRCVVGGDAEETFDEDAERELRVPAIPGRENIRLCGVEIEGGEGTGTGQDLAQAFYNEGLSAWDRMAGYHSGGDPESGFAHVERDSSVDWEAVIGPVNLALPEQVTQLNVAVRSIRQLVRDGVLTLDLRAGCHIHVEAARTSLDGAYNLNTLFAYAEDVIFRLAAARWPVHRAIQDTHYTRPIPKELRKVQFAQEHAESDNARYYALSFNNYFQQMLGRCRCGATRYDSWEDCTCDLGKCTFEFRVFNTTANPRKLHAYLALCQALVAKAMNMGKVEETSEFPALAFVSRRFKDMDEPAQRALVESWRERLIWLFRELPLTEDEKESLAYCVRHSELEAVGEDFINNVLLSEQQVIEEVTA